MKKLFVALVTVTSVLLQAAVIAQPIEVEQSESRVFASDCYQRALSASETYQASFSDIQACDQAVQESEFSHQDLLATYINRGTLYLVLGNFERAERDFDSALTLSDTTAEVYVNRGNLYFLQGQWEQAIASYQQAESLEAPYLHLIYLNRGMSYKNLGDLDQAETEYLAALEKVPGWEPATQKLDQLYSLRIEQQYQ